MIARSAAAGSSPKVPGATSASTKRAPTWLIAAVVARSLLGAVMTSSPGPIPWARRSSACAATPDWALTAIQGGPKYASKAASKAWVKWAPSQVGSSSSVRKDAWTSSQT